MPLDFCSTEPPDETAWAFVQAVLDEDVQTTRDLLATHAELRAQIDAPWFYFDAPAIVHAKSNREIVDLLLEHGADINVRSQWWAGSFGVLDDNEELAEYLVSRGAEVDVHAAAGMGDVKRLTELLDDDPQLVTARGGDGQHPLHFAKSAEIVDLLISRGAELEARDLDHSATPAQWQVDKPDICRRLLSHGATPDIFMAARLNDVELLKDITDREPDALASRVNECPHTRPVDQRSHLHIYSWNLDGEGTPLRVARAFKSNEAYEWLHARSPLKERFLTSLWYAERETVQKLLEQQPDFVKTLTTPDLQLLAEAAWEGKLEAVRLMLDVGFDPHVRGVHESTPLDRAAFHGYREIIELLLQHDPEPPIHWENEFGGTPLEACLYGMVHGWEEDTDYPGSVRALVAAGSRVGPDLLPCGNAEVDAILRHAAEADDAG